MNKIIAFDVSKKTINVYNDFKNQSFKINNVHKEITDFLKQFQEFIFVYEATGIYSSLLQKCCNDLWVKHMFFHPNDAAQLFVSLFWKNNKTDELDAKQLAQLTKLFLSQEDSLGKSKFITPSSNQVSVMRSHMSQIRFYKESIKQFLQRIEKMNFDAFADKEAIIDLQKQIEIFEKNIHTIESKIIILFETLWLTNKYEKLKTIPTVWQTTAIELTVFYSTLSDKWLTQNDKKKMLAYSWLNPDISQSWTSLNSTSISKRWDKNIRTALYMIGMQRFKWIKHDKYLNTTIGQFALKMMNKFGSPSSKRWKSVACAISHKILDIWRAIFHTEREFNGFLNTHSLQQT